jgi:hypothetical protein
MPALSPWLISALSCAAASFHQARLPRHSLAPAVQLGFYYLSIGDLHMAIGQLAPASRMFAEDGWFKSEFALREVLRT